MSTEKSIEKILSGETCWGIFNIDVIKGLQELPDESIQCCITSPPYWRLRDYGNDDQIGNEKNVGDYVDKMVLVFNSVRRKLRNDGTLWLNIGDSYSKKELSGVPWRVAFAMQDDGWYLRSDIIWNKPNAQPSSVSDRPGMSHEYVFLLSKSLSYFYDKEAIKERGKTGLPRNKRTVWDITTRPSKDPHLAIMPEELVRPCILSGTSNSGSCSQCGKPWKRVTERQEQESVRFRSVKNKKRHKITKSQGSHGKSSVMTTGTICNTVTIGWNPTCECQNCNKLPHIVLDPFCGSGTVGAVAIAHNRRFIGLDIDPASCRKAIRRLGDVCPYII